MNYSLQSKSQSETPSNTCPKCNFSGDPETFPKGFAMEAIGVKHCPKCGYWDEEGIKAYKKKMRIDQ